MNCNDCGGLLPRCDCSPFGGRLPTRAVFGQWVPEADELAELEYQSWLALLADPQRTAIGMRREGQS